MRLTVLKFLAFFVAVTAVNVSAKTLSAHRPLDTDFHQFLHDRHIDTEVGEDPTAVQSAVPLDKLDITGLTDWQQMDTAQTGFERLRDARFVFDDEHPTSSRRDTWLYPDDGCFARAALAKQNLVKWGFPAVKKIFAFGNLVVKTNNSPDGQVSWWYHVVNGITIGGEAYVLDPALEPLHPLTLKEWVDQMGGDAASITLSICSEGTYSPEDACQTPDASAEANAMVDQTEYLGAEWSRLEELKRDPVKELGDEPPWPLKYP
jgi:hypothetical protein